MTDSRRPYGAKEPAEIDDTEDRMGSLDELDFDDDETHEPISDLFTDEERARHMAGQPARNASLSGAAMPGDGAGDDDLDLEMLIPEDGARDAKEAAEGRDGPADWDLSVVDEDEIGAGHGLDEAQFAEIDPVGRTSK